ncbi:MAG: extracellular solute-binding protein [Propionibacteriaceae bacterium]|nr:extracellular solute-binding protein [Propionibacteriaceae bacterium]
MPRITRAAAISLAAATLLTVTACSGGFSSESPTPITSESANKNPVTVLIGSSGDAETTSVKTAVAAWSAKSGIPAEVKVASDLTQQATQGFAGGKPDDLLYVSTDQFAGWAKNGSLEAYGDQLPNKSDFYPGLVSAFSYDGKFYCAPKDFSTLALVINTDMWSDAGLTDADVPTTWDQLEAVAKKLTKGKRVGLAFSPEIARVGVFMAQAGGGLLSADGKAQANAQPNVDALTYVQKLLKEGVAAFSSDLGAGWGGEAFGKKQAAMVIEGNWITGAMTSTYPSVKYTVAELPAGTQKGTLQFTNCWGIAADADNKAGALSLVEFLTTTEQQLTFAKDFGVMPSVKSAAEQYKTDNPTMVPFINGAEYAQNLPSMPGAADVLKDFNSQLTGLKSKDPKTILDSTQTNLQAIAG